MSARIEGFESFTPLDWELIQMFDNEDKGQGEDNLFSGDGHTRYGEGNVLGAGELWQRLGSTQGPVVPSRTLGLGMIFPGASQHPSDPVGYITDGVGRMFIYHGVR